MDARGTAALLLYGTDDDGSLPTVNKQEESKPIMSMGSSDHIEQQSRTRMIKLYAIESVSPSDRMDGRSESNRLKEHITSVINARGTTHFQHDFADVLDKTQFNERMAKIELDISGEMENNDVLPFLHISCHGSTEYLKMTNGEILWEDLRELIQPISESCNGRLVLCISACNGISTASVGGNPSSPLNCLIIAPKGKPTWDQCEEGFKWLYESLILMKSVPDKISVSEAKKLVTEMNQKLKEEDLFQSIYLDNNTEHIISILKKGDIEPAKTVGLTRAFAKLVEEGEIKPEQLKRMPLRK